VFTRFFDTLTDIVARLREAKPGIRVGTYSGKGAEYFEPVSGRMVSSTREQVKKLFLQGEIDILVCTDAAAEGLNLQTADMVVNFDLGWNPMKIEQRVGRIDRIGQIHKDICVLNLCYFDSEEEVVYVRLLQRLEEAGLIVGTQQFTLLPIKPEEFAELAFHKVTLEELERRARERMEEQRRIYASMEVPARQLYEMYIELLKRDAGPLPADLSGIWQALISSKYLAALGCSRSSETDEVLRLTGIQGIPRNSVLTVSRNLYLRGLKENDANLHFATYGDPAFEAVLNQFNQFSLPGCVRRISVPVPGTPWAEMVAFAALVRSQDGNQELKLIKGLRDLEDLQLYEDATISEDFVSVATRELESLAQSEFGKNVAVENIERRNVQAAVNQAALVMLAAQALLESKAGSDPGAAFRSVYSELSAQIENSSDFPALKISSDALRAIIEDSLFDLEVVPVGADTFVTLPKTLLRCALDALSRAADSLKIRKTAITVNAVLERLRTGIAALRERSGGMRRVLS